MFRFEHANWVNEKFSSVISKHAKRKLNCHDVSPQNSLIAFWIIQFFTFQTRQTIFLPAFFNQNKLSERIGHIHFPWTPWLSISHSEFAEALACSKCALPSNLRRLCSLSSLLFGHCTLCIVHMHRTIAVPAEGEVKSFESFDELTKRAALCGC